MSSALRLLFARSRSLGRLLLQLLDRLARGAVLASIRLGLL